MKKSKKKSNHYVRSFLIFVAVFVVCCVSLWALIRHDIEVNYCLDGGRFEFSHSSGVIGMTLEHGEPINSDLNKPFPIQIDAQLPEISNILFDDYDKLVINTTCDFYTVDGKLLFREIESKIMTRSQMELSQRESGVGENTVETSFRRNITIKVNHDNNDTSNNKFIMVVSIENDNGQLIEIGAVEINTDVIEIRGKSEITMSGSASTIHKSKLITGSSSAYLHCGSYDYFGKYILLKSF